MDKLKQTALYSVHKSLNAKMVPFAGYEMPLEYTGVSDEHIAVRNSVGVFDVSHMGEFWISGSGANDLVQHVTSNDISKLAPGSAQYSCLPNGNGGIVDDLIVYKIHEKKYLLVVNAANMEKDWNWIQQQNFFGAEMKNDSDQIALIALQGPKATAILQKLTQVALDEIKFYHFTIDTIAGIPDVIISATGYTGAGGFELYVSNDHAVTIWNKIFEAGKDENIKPAGLAARDTLRLEMGFCLYGNDIDDSTSPIEASLGWITKFNQGNDFIDRERLWKQKQEGVSRKLKGFEMIDKGIPRQGYELVDQHGNKIGHVTSGTMSPMMKKGIGLGYVTTSFAKSDTEIFVNIRNKRLKARIVKLPIYKK
jgi:aminomethyltransferase